jgi:hypothetical protein
MPTIVRRLLSYSWVALLLPLLAQSGVSAGGSTAEALDPAVALATSGPLEGSVRFRIVAKLAESNFQIYVDKIRLDEEVKPEVLAHAQVPAAALAREPGERITDFLPREWRTSRSLAVRINERESVLVIGESGGSISVTLAQ